MRLRAQYKDAKDESHQNYYRLLDARKLNNELQREVGELKGQLV